MSRAIQRVRVGDLLREPASRRSLDRSIPAPYGTDPDALVATASAVIGGTDIVVSGDVIAMAGGVQLVGTVSYDWFAECRRCLDDVTGCNDVSFAEIAQREPVDDDVFPIEGDIAGGYVDLAPLVRELVMSTLPVAALCRPDCPGPDPERFPTTTEAEVEAEREADLAENPRLDPRWAALRDLKLDE